jgi:hypothetical protein
VGSPAGDTDLSCFLRNLTGYLGPGGANIVLSYETFYCWSELTIQLGSRDPPKLINRKAATAMLTHLNARDPSGLTTERDIWSCLEVALAIYQRTYQANTL